MRSRAQQPADRPLKVVFGGVCRDEVEAFFAGVAQDHQAVLEEIERMRAELAEVTAALVSAHADERETTRIISRAENDARAVREAAERQGADLLRAAETKAAALLLDVESEREQISRRIVRCDESRARLVRLLQTEIDELGLVIASGPQAHVPAVRAAGRTPTPLPPVTSSDMDDAAFHGIVAPTASRTEERDDELPIRGPSEAWSAEDVESALRALIETIPTDDEPDLHSERAPAPPSPNLPDDDIRGIAADPRYVAAAAEKSRDTSTSSGAASRRRYLPRLAWGAGAGALATLVIVALLAFPRTGTDAATPPGHVPASPVAHDRPPRAAASVTPAPLTRLAADTTPLPGTPSKTLVVRMQAIRPCWISVTINGEKEARLLGQGEEFIREADSDLILRVGDAGALVVTVNDRRVPPLGADGEVVSRRFTRN